MRRELLPGLDGGTDVKTCIEFFISLANEIKKEEGTFVRDFFRAPQSFFVGKKNLHEYLKDSGYILGGADEWIKNNVAVNDNAKKNDFKELVKSHVKDNQIDENMLTAFVDQWNQIYFSASNFFVRRLPFMLSFQGSSGLLVGFDSNGDYAVHVTPGENEIKIEVKKKIGYKFNKYNDVTKKHDKNFRYFSDCTQILIFKNEAAADEAPRYAVSHQSTEISDIEVNTLLREKPYANREYRLQRGLLCKMRNQNEENDPDLDNLLAAFDQMVINEVGQLQDCRYMDLTGVNLSELDLSGKDFSGADLTGADLTGADLTGADLTDVTLIGAKLPRDLKRDFTVKYRGAEFKHQDDVVPMIIKMRNAYYLKTGSTAPQINNIFELLRYIQENPKQDFSKAADRELLLTAIRKLAKEPVDRQSDDYTATQYLPQWIEAVNKKGLHAPEISSVLHYMNVSDYTNKEGLATKKAFTATDDQIPLTVFSTENIAVINVEKTLSQQEKPEGFFISSLQFAKLIASILKMAPVPVPVPVPAFGAAAAAAASGADVIAKDSASVDLIQMPLADGDHYMQLQIYKTTDGDIGARVIDSTANPFHDPTDFVRKLLIENREQLKTALGATSNTIKVGKVVRTCKQLNPGNKECGIYVAAGMKATAEKVLAKGAGFLSDDAEAEDAVKHQHHLVSKTEPMGYLMGMVDISNEQQPVTESAASASVGKSEQSKETVPHVIQPSAEAAGNDDDYYDDGDIDPSFTAPHKEIKGASTPSFTSDDDFENISDKAAAEVIEQTTQQSQSVTTSAYAHLAQLLNEKMDSGKLQTAVEKALKSYSEKNTGRFNLHFFRQFSSAGRDYATDAQARIKAAPEGNARHNVAREIAYQILSLGVQPDGKTIEVKHNSRVHHLLMALQEQRENAVEGGARDSSTSALVNPPEGIDFKKLGMMGCAFNAEKLLSAAGRQVAQPRQSL